MLLLDVRRQSDAGLLWGHRGGGREEAKMSNLPPTPLSSPAADGELVSYLADEDVLQRPVGMS